jgi:hypothetical protein
LKPPNGVWTRTEVFAFTERTPASVARATRKARAPSRVQIDPDRPYGVSFVMRIASASSSNGMTAATGPKTSSRAIGGGIQDADGHAAILAQLTPLVRGCGAHERDRASGG